MPWCPVCKDEYRSGFFRCKDCDVDLVEELDTEIEKPNKKKQSKTDVVYFEQETFIVNVNDEFTVDIIKGFLENDDIPILTKRKGTGNMHSLFMGIDVYVQEKHFEKAKKLLSDLNL